MLSIIVGFQKCLQPLVHYRNPILTLGHVCSRFPRQNPLNRHPTSLYLPSELVAESRKCRFFLHQSKIQFPYLPKCSNLDSGIAPSRNQIIKCIVQFYRNSKPTYTTYNGTCELMEHLELLGLHTLPYRARIMQRYSRRSSHQTTERNSRSLAMIG